MSIMVKQRRYETIVLIVIVSILGTVSGFAQNCDVDFPGTAARTFSGSCGGPTVNNLELGIIFNLSNGDTFTFDLPVVNITGNLHIDVDGSGKIIIPAGVTVNVGGNVQIHNKNSQCTPSNPCLFEIVVNGNANFNDDVDNDVFTVIWSGTGTVTIDDKLKNKNNACMDCGAMGCPNIIVDPSDCTDDGSCSAGDFCTKINSCSNDAIPPTITGCLSDQVVNISGPSCTRIVSWGAPAATDNCALLSLISTHPSGSAFPKGTTTVTYTATDVAGNTSSCSFNITVVDNVLPIISGCSSDITVNAGASCQAVVNWEAPTFSDNCPGTILTSTKSPGSTFNKGTTVVTYTATDAAGNSASCSFNVTVIDNSPPILSACPADRTVYANASCHAVVSWTPPSFSDNCLGTNLSSNIAPGSTFNKGTTVVTYTARDAAGNTAICSFNVTVIDNSPPVLSACPADRTVNATASCQAVVTWTPPNYSDNCSGTILSSSKAPGSTFNLGTTVVTYIARDAAGNTATCSFNVTVVDNAPPTLSACPANRTASANASCQAVVNWTPPTYSDNCSGTILSSTKLPGSTFNKGTTVVTYTATDAAGNKATCSFNVTVVDDTPPVFEGCPTNRTVNANAFCQAVVSWTPPSVSGNCSGTIVSVDKPPGSVFGLGTTRVTYTATTSSGQSSTCFFNVVVVDKLPPAVASIGTIRAPVGPDCRANVSWPTPDAVDCNDFEMESTHQPGDEFGFGSTNVTYTLTDELGNASDYTFQVVVENPAPPVISDCPGDITIEADEFGFATVSWVEPTAEVICGQLSIDRSHIPGQRFPIGITDVVYTASDDLMNESYCRFKIIILTPKIVVNIAKVVSPDGNGLNDYLQIDNIEKYKENGIVIVDRWGSTIFKANGYDNDKVVWRGTNASGGLAPTGTYFFSMSVRYGTESLQQTGFIELIR